MDNDITPTTEWAGLPTRIVTATEVIKLCNDLHQKNTGKQAKGDEPDEYGWCFGR
ncbi:MAG TPA: hypothetical protein VMX74_08270 [Pirellulales bacterium]|nr:hypothetical protein [Pirellulales bacterium]